MKQLQLHLSTEKEKPENAEPVQKPKPEIKLRDIVHLTPERKSQLAQIFNLPHLDWKMREAAGEEAGNEYMEELEEATEYSWIAGFVFWKRWDNTCISTAVFTLTRNTYYMDWTPVPVLDDPGKKEKEKEFFEKKRAKRRKEISDKKFAMGCYLLRHEYEPLGLFCIDHHDDPEDDEVDKEPAWNPEVCTVLRFAFGSNYTPADQDFLETVAHAMKLSAFAEPNHVWNGFCVQIDFWKQDDGTFGFHFPEGE